MISWLLHWDVQLFHLINESFQNRFLDLICPFLRQAYFWLPLYGFILAYALLSDYREGYKWLIGLIVVFAFTDLISAQLLKPIIERIRPCHSLSEVHLLVNCGSGFSFPSSHATNHFGLSYFILYTQRKKLSGLLQILLVLWALAVSFAQVYVGVHFPLDVITGAIIGWLIAKFISLYYLRSWKNRQV